MKILIVSATKLEVLPIIESNECQSTETGVFQNESTTVLVTGIGMVATAAKVAKHLAKNSYDLVLNAGIAGAIDFGLELGTVVEVVTDEVYELGIDDKGTYYSLADAKLLSDFDRPDCSSLRLMGKTDHEQVKGMTVNLVHGDQPKIDLIHSDAQVETMEGAGFMYACMNAEVQGVQLRAISNYVTHRDKSEWEIGTAIKNLNEAIQKILDQ